jgi:ABC-2 type transport system permease protein/ribosome-dependent ATPase
VKLAKVWLVARKEWREIVRDKTFLALAFLLAPLMMVVCGYGINQTMENMPLVVVDEDRSAESRAYADRFSQQHTFEFRGFLPSEAQADAALAAGDARAVLVIPAGFAQDVARGHARVVTRIDGTLPPSTRRTLEGYVAATSSAANAELAVANVAARLDMPASQAEVLLRPLRLEVRHRYNPDLVNLWFTAPALIVFVLIFVLPMLTALSVVREKETGSIYNARSSTLSRGEFLLGKLVPNIAISAINAAFLWALARYLFGAPFRGSIGFFALGTLLYVLNITALGLVLSLLVRSQVAAMIIAALVTNVVGTQYSGLTVPISSLSGVSQLLARLMPPMHYLEIVQGTFLKGLGVAELWPEAAVLAVQAASALVVAWALFHKRTAV